MSLQLDTERPPAKSVADGIYELLNEWAEKTPAAVALVAPDRQPLTYRRLLSQVEATIRALSAAGLGRNDRAAIVLPNGPEMAVTFLAVASCATCAPLNPAYKEEEFEFYISDLNARALIIASGVESAA